VYVFLANEKRKRESPRGLSLPTRSRHAVLPRERVAESLLEDVASRVDDSDTDESDSNVSNGALGHDFLS
jgi:hypothetical protein